MSSHSMPLTNDIAARLDGQLDELVITAFAHLAKLFDKYEAYQAGARALAAGKPAALVSPHTPFQTFEEWVVAVALGRLKKPPPR